MEGTGLKPPPPKAEGLKALKRTGLDNTGIAMNIHEYNGTVLISGGSHEDDLSYNIMLPENVNIVISNQWFSEGKNIRIKGMKGEIELHTMMGKVDLIDISGPVVAKVDNGELNVIFSEVSQEGPMSLISSQSDIDITLPASAEATFKLAAGSGEIYTDLNLEKIIEEEEELQLGVRVYSKDKKKFVTPRSSLNNLYRYNFSFKNVQNDSLLITQPFSNYNYAANLLYTSFFGGYDFKGTLNGGGVEITVRTQNGNLYLRKSKR